MAVAVQSVEGSIADSGDNTATWTESVTVAAGSDRLLIVHVHTEDTGSGVVDVTGVTYGGVALTRLGGIKSGSWGGVDVWYLIAPAVGTANVVVSLDTSDVGLIGAYVLTGVGQTTPFGNTQSGSGGSGTGTGTETVTGVASGDLVIDALTIDATGHNGVQGANQTEQYDVDGGGGGCEGYSSTQAGADGGDMSYTWTTSAPFAYFTYRVIQASSGAQTVTQTSRLDRVRNIFAPSLSWGQTVTFTTRLDRVRSIFAPTITPGSVSIAPARLDRVRSIFAPTITPGAVTLTLARLDRARQIFAPSVLGSGTNILLERLDRARQIFGPTLTTGAVTITQTARLDRVRQIFAPTVGDVEPPATPEVLGYGFRGQDSPTQRVDR